MAEVEVQVAMAVLGVGSGHAWGEVRAAYRRELLAAHPDVNAGAGSAERTDELVAAYRVLRQATANGARPLPAPSADSAGSAGSASVVAPEFDEELIVLHARPGNAFDRICEAAESIGQISYIDRNANLLQIMVEFQGWAPAHLTVELEDDGPVITAAFSLDSLSGAAAPPIAEVVAELAASLRAPRPT